MNRRLLLILTLCLALLLIVLVGHEAFHHDAADCFICSWVSSFRETLGALLLLTAARIAVRLILLSAGVRVCGRPPVCFPGTPVRLRVKITD